MITALIERKIIPVMAGALCCWPGSPSATPDAAAAEAGVHVDPLTVSGGVGGFVALAAGKTGVAAPGASGGHISPVVNCGAAAGDVDGDGLVDLCFANYDGRRRLFRNLGGWKFVDETEARLPKTVFPKSVGVCFTDVDGDADLDLVATSLDGGDWLLLNDGSGRFTEKRRLSGAETEKKGGASSATLADVDGDGDLDLYLARYRKRFARESMRPGRFKEIVSKQMKLFREGRPLDPDFESEFMFRVSGSESGGFIDLLERGTPDSLLLNDGHGNLAPVKLSERFRGRGASGMRQEDDWGLCGQFRDVDGDGDPDLYVCNDFDSPDRFWINDGRGHFDEALPETLRRTSNFCMGVDFSDINADGSWDFFTVDMLSRRHERRKTQMGDMRPTPVSIGEIFNRPQIMQNTLFVNRGDGTYAEIAQHAGLKASEWSWCAAFMDVDLDGYEDLLVTTGMVRDYMDSDTKIKMRGMKFDTDDAFQAARELFPPLPTSNFAFRNRGDLRFEDRSRQWGLGREAVSGGLAMADLDNDGDLDIAINNMDGAPEIYRNDSGAPRVAVRLKGRAPNTQAIGAKIELEGGPVLQRREVIAGGRYASGSDTLQVFAAGKSEAKLRLKITWRNGRQTVVKDVRANHLYEIEEGKVDTIAATRAQDAAAQQGAWFEDWSDRLKHRHVEKPFDDFARQPLLPNRLSQLGPGAGWVDLDDDGDEDLLIGSGAGGRMAAYINDGRGGLGAQAAPTMPVDQAGIAAWSGGRLLVGISNHESGSSEHASGQVFDLKSGQWNFGQGLIGSESTSGPLATGDIDGDGDLDLFVGGRAVPGRYPAFASSRIFLNQDGRLRQDPANADLLKDIGLVSGAVMGDIDGDGDSDLALACEWGPVRLLRNDRGVFHDATSEAGLASRRGWWNSVTLGDFDNDGRLDIVAGNWGLNSKYEHSYQPLQPLLVYHGDFDSDGRYDVVEAHHDKQMNCLVPERGYSCSSRAMPYIRQSLGTFRAFATSPLEQIYGPAFRQARSAGADTLAHTIFLNRGRRFEARELPNWSQLAPAFGLSVGDLDGDGNEDLFMAQNFFAVQNETPRNDGGRGLLLRGDGRGNFEPVKGQTSGIKVYGEQRGSALGDVDGDRRPDLVVTQNGAETKLYRNAHARPGLRVRLQGPAGNERGIGAVVRLEYADGMKGPARALLGGSGYWSQETLTPILGVAKGRTPKAVHVDWPGGTASSGVVAAGVTELVVRREE